MSNPRINISYSIEFDKIPEKVKENLKEVHSCLNSLDGSMDILDQSLPKEEIDLGCASLLRILDSCNTILTVAADNLAILEGYKELSIKRKQEFKLVAKTIQEENDGQTS